MPDANTLWDFREALIARGALDLLFERLDRAIKEAGYLPMSGQIVDASLVAAPRQRNTKDEKDAIRAGKSADEIWLDQPAKAAQKDTDARWSMKISKGKVDVDGKVLPDIAIPAFGYKSHISIDARHGFIRRQKVTNAAAYNGARLREGLIDRTNTESSVFGGHDLSLPGQRELPGRGREDQPDPSKEAEGQADAEADSQGQCQEVEGAGARRACLCASEG